MRILCASECHGEEEGRKDRMERLRYQRLRLRYQRFPPLFSHIKLRITKIQAVLISSYFPIILLFFPLKTIVSWGVKGLASE